MAALCRSCGLPIRWAETTKGRRIPLDPLPSANGNVRLRGDLAEVLGGGGLAAAQSAGKPLYMPHHATCPQGKGWKRSSSKGRRTMERRDG